MREGEEHEAVAAIARAMAKADGNDPHALCIRHGITECRLSGLASGARYQLSENLLTPVWVLYYHLAEVAFEMLAEQRISLSKARGENAEADKS